MQKTIWITGASSGIGREFARRYAAMGCRLILTARRADRLQALAKELHAAHGTECRIETADLSRAEECSRCAKYWPMSTSTSSSTTPVSASAAAFWKRRKPARKR